MRSPLFFIAGLSFICLSTCRADEIFFKLDSYFNSRILADDTNRTSGQGFGGSLNVKCLNPNVTPQGIMKAFNYVEFKVGDLALDNATLLNLGEKVEIPLAGRPKLTSLAFVYTSYRYDVGGAGAGTVTVFYADDGQQTFTWADLGASGINNPNYSQTSVGVAGFHEWLIGSTGVRMAGQPRIHNRVLNGLDPSRELKKIVIDTKGFIDPGADAEWAIFALTGNGRLGEKSPLAEINPGARPYEMVWANRTKDEFPAFVDFQDVSDWRVEGKGAVGYFASTEEKPVFYPKSARLEIRSTDKGMLGLLPPAPIKLPKDFNAVSLWVYGDGIMQRSDLSPNQKLSIKALFQAESGRSVEVDFMSVRHGEWFQMHHQFTPGERALLGNRASFIGFDVSDFAKDETRVLYLASFAVFDDPFRPLSFKAQPKRGVELLPGADSGVNTGVGRLPFPTTEKTILPLNFSTPIRNFTTWVEKTSVPGQAGKSVLFSYEGEDITIHYLYSPKNGDLGDIKGKMIYADGKEVDFTPALGGGLRFGEDAQPATSARFVSIDKKDEVVTVLWEFAVGGKMVPASYRLRIWNKSIVVDILCAGGKVSRVLHGSTAGLTDPRLVATPYYTYNIYSKDRPSVVVSGEARHPLFFAAHTDWYLSNGSEPYALNSISEGVVTSNGGVRYNARTDGLRNDCAERFFLTASPVYDEVLPTVDNPVSPRRESGYSAMWLSQASSASRYQQGRQLYRYWRQGIKELRVTDHEVLFRDHEESFTFRTKTAPLKGGDEGARWISDYLHKTLGYEYGSYCQFTDFGTTNEYFKLDHVIRDPDNQLQHAWFRMYAPKPVWAQEMAGPIAAELKAKFGYTNSYADVHTAIAPWQLVDYDSRSPGAGTFAQTFYSYGQLLLGQKAAWQGSVYSEGNYHSFYAGLTDGDYAQDKGYRLAFNPWLVNFDLRNMHNLNANIGMGDMYMFMWQSGYDYTKDKAAGSFAVDRLIAATLAYGHSAIIPKSANLDIAAPRTHFMAVPITRLYGLSRVAEIGYLGKEGQWLSASAAILEGSHVNSQLLIRYENGTVVVANGAPDARMLAMTVDGRDLKLPQNGYSTWSADGKTEVLSSLDEFGNPFDYAVTPNHIYIDGRGKMVRRELAASNGPAVLRILGGGEFEYIPLNAEFVKDYLQVGKQVAAGFAIQVESVVALDYEMNEMPDKVEIAVSRGLSWVMPVKGAYSYRIKGLLTAPAKELRSESSWVFPGQTVTVSGPGDEKWSIKIPGASETNSQIWRRFGERWLDFMIIEPFKVTGSIESDQLAVKIANFLPNTVEAEVEVDDVKQAGVLNRDKPRVLIFPLVRETGDHDYVIKVSSGEFKTSQSLTVSGVNKPLRYATLTDQGANFGVSLRGGDTVKSATLSSADVAAQNALISKETVDVGGSGAMMSTLQAKCGEVVKQAIGLQVPYKGTTGYVYLSYANIALPAGTSPVLKTSFGKRDGSHLGDGLLYKVMLTDAGGREQLLGETWVKKHQWIDFVADLKPWAGQQISLKFICDAGGDSDGDWGALATVLIEDVSTQMQYTIK